MPVTFNGPAKLIVCDPGTTSLDVRDTYSRWKDWALTNSQFEPAFGVVGGEPTTPGNSVAPYFFLLNGWRVRPQEADHTLNVTGSLLVEGGGDPIIPTVGTYRVLVVSAVPVRAEAVATGGAGADPSAIATAVWAKSTAAPTPGSYGAFLTGKLLTVAKFLGLK